VRPVADRFAGGASGEELLEQYGLSPEGLVQCLCEARDRGWLERVKASGNWYPTGAVAQPGRKPQGLLALLRDLGPCLRNVTVFRSVGPPAPLDGRQEWYERIQHFGRDAAPALVSLLSRAAAVGVGWGRVVASAIQGIGDTLKSPPRRENPLHCVATAGGHLYEVGVRPESSSSMLTVQLAQAINGDRNPLHFHTLHGIEAFIASYLGSDPVAGQPTRWAGRLWRKLVQILGRDEVEFVRRRLSRTPPHQAIFGLPGQLGKIDQLDAIITSCGNTHYFNLFWTTVLTQLRVSPERLNELTHGNIGGVLLPRENLPARDRALLDDFARRWTGIRLEHFKLIAGRDPGVILLALTRDKADVVLQCVQMGLVTELLIDEDLAVALWDRLDREGRGQPRDLTPLLWRREEMLPEVSTPPERTSAPPAPEQR
jgi:DNA-binding transcriptional regulator LsrR (DeoR family)